MCGFLISNIKIEKNNFVKASMPLKDRGPDDMNYIFLNEFNLHLIHYRLGIINPENSVQPMHDQQKRYVILFNGLIYNYKDIQSELISLGINFYRKNSDTEVLLEAYKYWGEKCVEKLDGMFSFVVIDKNNNEIFFARDKFGEKPLFYKIDKDEIYLSSNLKTIQIFKNDSIDNLSVTKYMYYGYIPQPSTIFKNIHKVPPGTFFRYCLKKKRIIKSYKYFKLELENKVENNHEEPERKLEHLLKKAITSRSISDVPMGNFLSGGLDSSIICKLRSESEKIETFGMAFENNSFDESKYARQMANFIKSKHNEFSIKTNDILDDLSILKKMDEPICDSSLIPTTKLCFETKKKVKSIISGDGADELQYGYNIFQAPYFANIVSKIFPKIILNKINLIFKNSISYSKKYMSFEFKLKKFLDGLDYHKTQWISEWLSYSNIDLINQLTGYNYKRDEILTENDEIFSQERMIKYSFSELISEYFIKMYFSNNILTKIDRAGMQNGLETRLIFTEPNLFQFLYSLDQKQKGTFLKSKILLKKTFSKKIPYNIINRKKHGFAYPTLNAIDKLNRNDYFNNILIFDKQIVKKKVNDHFSSKKDNKMFLWSLVNLNEFLR